MSVCEECGEPKKFRQTRGAVWRVRCNCPDFADFEPKERATIIIPSKFPDIFADCRASIDRFAPKEKKILVRDGTAISPPAGWTTLQGSAGPFVYSRNINLGIKESTGDVLLTNDDIRFLHSGTLETLQNIMHQHPEVGILSPLIKGDVGEYHQGHCIRTLEYTDVRLCFVCVLIKREVIDKVGLLDEEFVGYGGEDVSYCREIVRAGWKMGVTARAMVVHGDGKQHRSMSYNRQENGTIEQLDKIAMDYYEKKYGDREIANF